MIILIINYYLNLIYFNLFKYLSIFLLGYYLKIIFEHSIDIKTCIKLYIAKNNTNN